MATYYWIGTSGGTWDNSTTTNWSASSGGSGGAGVPGSADTAIFDNNSGSNTISTGANISITALTLNTGFTGTVLYGSGYSFTASGTVALTQGTLNTNGQTCTWGIFAGTGSGSIARTLTLGASSITITSNTTTGWLTNSTNFTLNAGTSTITLGTSSNANVSFNSALTYNNIVVVGNVTQNLVGAFTCANMTINCIASKTNIVTFANSFTVTGTFTATGNSTTNRILVSSSVIGTQTTITAASVSLSNVDFMDIQGSGTASPFSGTSLGDCLGNSGITMTAATTLYAVVAGNWSSTATWSTSSGGSGGARVPLPQDSVIFDGNSAATTYTVDMPRLGANLTCTGFTHTFISNTTSCTLYGNLTLASTMTFGSDQSWNLAGRGSQTLNSSGFTFPDTYISAPGGSYTLQANFAITIGAGQYLLFAAGTFNTNNYSLTAGSFRHTSAPAPFTLNLGSSTVTAGDTSNAWNFNSSGITVNAGTSTIILSDTSSSAKAFNGQGQTYYNVTFNGGGTGAVIVSTANTFNTLTVGAPKTVTFPASTTQTVSNFVAMGSSGNVITINSSSSGTQATLKKTGGTVACNYVSLQDSKATGSAVWYAGSNSTNVSDNSGWLFTTATLPAGFFELFN